MKIEPYCTCGAVWKGDVNRVGEIAIRSEWSAVHHGDGHGPCDYRQASRARAKAEKDEH